MSLKSKLEKIGGITSTDWNLVSRMIELIKSGEAKIISKEWGDFFKNENIGLYPLGLEKINNWSTFQGLAFFKPCVLNDKIVCTIDIYDGDTFNGAICGLRWTASIELKDNALKLFEREIDCKVQKMASNAYHAYLENAKREWIKEYIEKEFKED